jgi:glycosyltransferase involved in cell wall biosynthesis
MRATLKRVDQAWVLTQAHRDIFDGYIPADRVRVLENTSEDIGSQFQSRLASGPHRVRRLLYLSNLFPEKGCFDLLDALTLLGEDAKGVELRMVGEADASVAAEVRRRAARLASDGIDVRYDGVLTGVDKVAAFAWADAFVLPTRYPPEGQPLCLLEAMSAGLPIISTFHSGIPCTVRDRREALLVEPGDRAALASAIRGLLGDDELSARIGSAARRRYHDRYRPTSFEAAVSALLVGTGCAPTAGS